ncbi:MAG TPA: hypothetical protein VF046_08775 [Gemmatimonadales bacterium]
MTRLVSLLLALLLTAAPLAAQAPLQHLAPQASSLFVRPPSAIRGTPDTTVRSRPTHWKRGLLIGGGLGAAGFGLLGYGLCHDLDESHSSCLGPTLGIGVVGAVIGGVTGALIGGAFPKRPRAPADSAGATRRDD